MTDYMTPSQAAKLWHMQDQAVRVALRIGRIPGAVREGRSWKIPVNAEKPQDRRRKLVGASAI